MSDLKRFILSRRVRSLYRNVCRSTKRLLPIKDPKIIEVRDYAKTQIRTMKHINDVAHIAELIRDGNRQLEQLEKWTNLTR